MNVNHIPATPLAPAYLIVEHEEGRIFVPNPVWKLVGLTVSQINNDHGKSFTYAFSVWRNQNWE